MRKINLFIFFILFVSINAQKPLYKTLNVNSGMPSDIVYDIAIDSKGYIWAVTENGVVKFDGKNIVVFNKNNGLLTNDNFKLLVDKKDNIWLYSYLGICYINNKGKVKVVFQNSKPYYFYFKKNSKDNLFFTFIDEDNFKKEKMILNDQVKSIESNYLKYKKYMQNTGGFKSIIDDTLYHMVFNNINKSLVFCEKYKNGKFELTTTCNRYDFYLKNFRNSTYHQINSDNSLLLAINEFKYFNKFKTKKYGVFPNGASRLSDNQILKFKNNLFIPLDKGLYVFEFSENNISFQQNLLPDFACTGVVKDIENNFWISTLGNGIVSFSALNFLKINKNHFNNINPVMIEGFENKKVIASFNNGLNYDIVNNIKYQTPLINQPKQIIVGKNKIIIAGNSALYFDSLNYIVNKSVKSISFMGNKVALLTFGGVKFIDVWKLNKMDLNKVTEILDIPIKANTVLLISNKVFIGNQNGLSVALISDLNLKTLKLIDHDKQPVIKSLKIFLNNYIIASTDGDGIFLIKDQKVVRQFKEELLDPSIHSLKIDEKDNIWISTKKGINRISRQNGKYVVDAFTSFHGLPSDYVFDTYCYNDTLYAATNQGLVLVDLCELEKEDFTMPPPVYVQDVSLITPGKARKLYVDSTSSLKNDENDLFIRFTGISYRSNGNVKYEYRLLPSIKEWRATENDNVTFDDLHSGNYSFEVRAINAMGTKSITPAAYHFVVQKHLTETLWFKLLTSTGVTLLIWFGFYLWFHYRKRKEQERYIYQRQISELKLKSLQAQMNPHFIFNSLNAIQQFINVENKRAANDYLARFARLMRFYLNGSENQFITLEEEVNIIKLYCSLEHLRFSDRFTYTIDIEENLPLAKYMVPAMLLQPHIENAIRHGLVPAEKENNHLSIRLYQVENGILCVLEDNGIGRTHSMAIKEQNQTQHRSLGNKLSQERILLIRSLKLANIEEKIVDLKNEKGENSGTRVEILVKEMVNYPQLEYAKNDLPHH